MKRVPASPSELADELASVFPGFHVPAEEGDGEASYHSVMREFASYFGRNASESSQKQLRACAELLVRCSAAPGDLENAMDTCFLEHTRQLRVDRELNPHLKEARKGRTK
jgi:hypothetical protein